MAETINRRESAALMNSLTGGVVPRIGLRHIAVGREPEVRAFLQDLQTVEEGGGAFRFVSGQYGSGKTFLLQLIRNNAMDRGFVVLDADLSPERRLTGTQRQGLATFQELMQNFSTRTRPDGGGLESVLQKWISGLQAEEARKHGLSPKDDKLIDLVSARIADDLKDLSEMAYGFAFAGVLDAYWRGMKTGDDELKNAALRWLRGEYATKTEARRELPVDRIIDDQNWYDFLKLFAAFVHMAGYQGLLIFIDEGVNLYKIQNSKSRQNNYEKILTMFNDTRQGKAHYIGIFFGGTPQFIRDERRGLYSYEALRSRLADNRFVSQGFADYTAPVLEISQLSNEELYLLLERLTELHESFYKYKAKVGSKEFQAFLEKARARVGANNLLTPREITRDYLGMLNILHQNPQADFYKLLEQQDFGNKDAGETDDSADLFADFDL